MAGHHLAVYGVNYVHFAVGELAISAVTRIDGDYSPFVIEVVRREAVARP